MKKDIIKTVESDPLTKSKNQFPVVGVGASAGGLDAFQKLLHAIPEKSGMAYVLVQHLDPNHESLLPELLQKITSIPVLQIKDEVKILPDHIYIIPSNKMLIANDGVLQLSPRITKKNERNLPIDLFFTSLAEIHQAHSIGIVLSGLASDGTAGLQAIKEQGGLTFAQDNSATFKDMPRSAVQAGVVDFILPPEEMPKKLLEIKKIILDVDINDQSIGKSDEEVFKQILSLLRIRKGTDFTYYKQSTIRRRILRRMTLNKNQEATEYLKFLREHKDEQDVLYQNLLIPVTSFFRDAKSFDNICNNVFPLIIKNKSADNPIRMWIAGCSTGEEAYSIAICLKEMLGENNAHVQIFATDLSEPAISKARSGIYLKNNIEGLTPKRLKEFFTKNNEGYQVNKRVRDMCVFAVHNFLKDPPFGKMDFISCRNVLIYMEPYLQKKALTTFHYSLNKGGFLLLGKSETISSVPELFSSVVKSDKLFSRKDVPGKFMITATQRSENNLQSSSSYDSLEITRTDFQKTADDIILSQFTPASVVVNEANDIVHFRGKTNLFLEQPEGKPTSNLFKMAKEGLAFELRNLLHKAKKEKLRVSKEDIPLQFNGNLQNISIQIIPLPNTIELYYLIIFYKNQLVVDVKTKPTGKLKKDDKDLRIKQLELELSQTREDIRSIAEDQEAANEELQSANEELLSSSEEMQSLNEELETGKEELQSTNEELTVVNQEMISLNEQVTEERDYSQAIIATMHHPMLVLNKNFRVKAANQPFYEIFKVSKDETEGMLIYDLGDHQWDIPQLRKLLEEILPKSNNLRNFEVEHNFPKIGNKIMLLNARQIIQKGNKERLILLTLADVTEVRKLAFELQLKEKELLKKKVANNKIEKADFEKAIKERTEQVVKANLLLEDKNLQLSRMNNELEAFTYVASHDLQEPLRKIQTFAGRIIETENQNLSESEKVMFKKMQASSERMRTLIQDLLAFSRLGATEPKFEKTDLNLIIDQVIYEYKETIEEKQAIINVKELCEVRIVPFQFRQLMHNLIGNALKFSNPKIPPQITISCSNKKHSEVNIENLIPKKEYCHLIISDNGIGFEKEYGSKVFELFQKLHGKDEYAGTGIGLAIVKKIVENHNGVITATSELGKGVRFDIYIPA